MQASETIKWPKAPMGFILSLRSFVMELIRINAYRIQTVKISDLKINNKRVPIYPIPPSCWSTTSNHDVMIRVFINSATEL